MGVYVTSFGSERETNYLVYLVNKIVYSCFIFVEFSTADTVLQVVVFLLI